MLMHRAALDKDIRPERCKLPNLANVVDYHLCRLCRIHRMNGMRAAAECVEQPNFYKGEKAQGHAGALVA